MTGSSPPRLLGAAEIRRLAEVHGVSPTKQWGQNFVIDANTVRRIVKVSGVGLADTVVEIGPGLGSLTLALLDEVARVVAIEVDPVLAKALPETIAEARPGAESRLVVVGADALAVTADDLARALRGDGSRGGGSGGEALRDTVRGPTALVANLPYNISVPVLLHMWEQLPTLRRGLVMVQAEVADRLAAVPGSKIYGVPSLKIRWYCRVSKAGSVGRNVFWPAPNVDSGLVLMERVDPPALAAQHPAATRQAVFDVIDAAFSQRRKTLRSALAGWAGSPVLAERILRAAEVDPGARGEVLGLDDFVRICAARASA